jgi:hypothetical protein
MMNVQPGTIRWKGKFGVLGRKAKRGIEGDREYEQKISESFLTLETLKRLTFQYGGMELRVEHVRDHLVLYSR